MQFSETILLFAAVRPIFRPSNVFYACAAGCVQKIRQFTPCKKERKAFNRGQSTAQKFITPPRLSTLMTSIFANKQSSKSYRHLI
jgi:hypothetical protein